MGNEEADEAEEESPIVDEPVAAAPVAAASAAPAAPAAAHAQTKSAPSRGEKAKTAGGKPPKKEKNTNSSPSSSSSKKKKNSSFQLSGTHAVAGCLALVVMIQLGLFVYEGWLGDQQTWA